MVLTNTLIVGSTLLVLLCTRSSISEVQKKQSQLPETTTISAKSTTEIENLISTTQKLSTISSKPKTDVINSKHTEQRKNRGSTKYTDYTYSTTETTRETTTTSKQNLEDTRSAKLTTIRNDRSLSLNTDKYNSPEFHSENNIYSEVLITEKKYANANKEKLTTQKSWEHANFAQLELTTPKNEIFDNKYRKIQEDITNSFNDVLTTDRNEILGNKYQQIQENIEKSSQIELTTPKDEVFDKTHRKIQEDLTKSLSNIDDFFNERSHRESLETPQLNNSNLDYSRYRKIEAIESKENNKVHKDYNTETGMRMKLTSDYNNSQIIDAPGIVVNTIPTHKDTETAKKIDLDQDETTLERVSIEKPEKDPSSFINNKIENEMVNTEGPVEKPFEHKSIYLSKRGSTAQHRDQSIEKKISTESMIPLDLYPSRTSTPNFTNAIVSVKMVENDTTVSKNTKKDKMVNKILKKELQIGQPDLDNKIPKLLPLTTSQNIQIETMTVDPNNGSREIAEESTGTFSEVDNSSTPVDAFTSTPSIEIYTSETPDAVTESGRTTETINFYDIPESNVTSEFFEGIDTTTVDILTIDTELIMTDHGASVTEQTESEQTEDGMTESSISSESLPDNPKAIDNVISTTPKIARGSQTWRPSDVENTVFSYNQSTNKITNVAEHLNSGTTPIENIKATTNIMNITDDNPTEPSIIKNATLFEPSDTATTERLYVISVKKNETIPNVINEITKSSNLTNISISSRDIPSTESIKAQWDARTEGTVHTDEEHIKENVTKHTESDQTKQNEINGDKLVSDECENLEESDDYGENNCKPNNAEEGNDPETELEDTGHGPNTHNEEKKYSTAGPIILTSTIPVYSRAEIPTTNINITNAINISTTTTTTPLTTTVGTTTTSTTTFRTIVQKTKQLETTEAGVETTARTESMVGSEDNDEDGGNGGKIAAIVISTIGGICLLLLVALLIIMKKRQKRFNYGQRCRPVSLDAYSMDNVSIHNSTRRKGVLMTSKRSYGNPAFEDPTSPTHLLNISELLKFANNQEGLRNEFEKIPQVTTKTNELPEGCDVKNRYANVIPLPETRVFLSPIEGVPSSDYINANYVTGAQGSRHYYIACQAPLQSTIEDFWRMIWEQQSKVVLMITHLYESGVEKCIDYLPPSEVLDCHRLFGDYQITLKKREAKDKYIISSLQLKNMVSNSWREITHLWYMGWPEKGVPEEANSLIAFLIEARSCMKISENKDKETNNINISNGFTPNINPVIVHCSPGTGRTGTVIACDIAIREFELTRKVDIPRIVYRIRRDRANAVQTKEQYAFVYKAINFYATKLTGGVFDSF